METYYVMLSQNGVETKDAGPCRVENCPKCKKPLIHICSDDIEAQLAKANERIKDLEDKFCKGN